ncbi:hypothetical protein E4U53_003195, partial [Claviceps sorghi]
FQLRFAPALADKPKPKAEPDAPSRHADADPDPFARPPPALFLADVGPAHYLVLNKFAVVPGHFILATRAFKPQDHVLEPADVEATMACLEAYAPRDGEGQGQGQGLFAFFNSGAHSGASQPHRHVQFLPVEHMREGLPGGSGTDGPRWSVLAGRAAEVEGRMPFVVFAGEVRRGMSPEEVHGVYLRLYREGCRAVMRAGGLRDGGDAPAGGPALMSYNLALTGTSMVLCPRLAEGGPVVDRRGAEVGRLGVNGTVLAGTALVKSEAEWEALRERPGGLADVLRGIGIPRE